MRNDFIAAEPDYQDSMLTLLEFLKYIEDDKQRHQMISAALTIVAGKNAANEKLTDTLRNIADTKKDYELELKNQRIRYLNLLRLAGIDGEDYL